MPLVRRPSRTPSSPPGPNAAPTLEALTEAGFHAWLGRTLPAGKGGPLPLGDDCAAVPAGGHLVHLLTTDAVLEGTHFPPEANPRVVGRFAANVNFSDLAAKGGRPIALLGALLVPPRTPARWAQELVLGLEEGARLAGCHLVGGDSKRAERRGVVPVAIGEADDRRLMPISGAVPGDLVATTGTVGRGSAAFRAWKEEALSEHDALSVLLNVRPRLREGIALGATAHATTDTSDGLMAGIRHLCEASQVSVRLVGEWIPWDPLAVKVAWALGLSVEEVALGGGDYELLTVFPRDRFDATLKNVARAGGRVTVLGRIVDRKEPSAIEEGEDGEELRTLPEAGWDAFAPS